MSAAAPKLGMQEKGSQPITGEERGPAQPTVGRGPGAQIIDLQRSVGNRAVGELLQGALNHGGERLDPATRCDMESRFGEDFGAVRVHTGSEAFQSARAIAARAFTFGADVVFGEGQLAPRTKAGEQLIAHELAHVVQQRAAAGRRHR